MNISQSDRGNVRDDLVRCHALVLMPRHDVLDPNAVAINARPTAAGLRCFYDPLIWDDAQPKTSLQS